MARVQAQSESGVGSRKAVSECLAALHPRASVESPPFVKTVLTAGHHKELRVLRAVYLLGLKKPAQLLEIEV